MAANKANKIAAGKVTVLGTGIMGTGVVHSLLRAGLDVTVWNRTRERAAPLQADGARVATSASDAVAQADVVITVVFDAQAVLDLLTETAAALPPGAVWMQASTVGTDGAEAIAALAAQHGIPLVETMMLGTKQPAEDGKLVLLTAGDPDLLAGLGPVLDALSQKVINAGDTVGRATALKLACNAWIAAITAATAQSLALTRAQGLDPQLFLDAIEGGAVDCSYAHLKGATMIDGSFDPQFAVDGLRKDLGLIAEVADRTATATRLVHTLKDLYTDAGEAGHGDDDIAAVFTVMAGTRQSG